MNAEQLYPDCFREDMAFDGPGSYQPIIDSMGEVVIQQDDNDYQGDTRVIYKDGNQIGWLQFGWGSCSGCDALQACNSYEEVNDLINGLTNQIRWFDSQAEALKFFLEHDWEGDYSWHAEEQKKFVSDCVAYLKGGAI